MSNGSERTPERCVHAPVGPDWAGLRELPTPKPNFAALVEVALARYKLACEEMDRLTAGNPGSTWRWSIPANPDRDSDLILSASAEDVPRLVAAVEALVAERDALRAQLGTERDYSTISSAIRVRDANIRQLTRRNEELRARLDSMIVELHTTRSVSGRGLRRQKRLVSSWTVVEGDDQ